MQNVLGMLPLNISLLVLNAENTRNMKQVKVLDIFDINKNFHPEGLFSSEIFGKVGDEHRNRLFAYVDLHIPVFHPLIFREVVSLKELYGKIMAGTAYAVFNPATRDFEASTVDKGETGFDFFLEHFNDLQFERRPGSAREFSIRLVEKERKNAMMSRMLIMPAGLRDFVVLPNGKPEEDEINNLYRRIISTANIIGNQTGIVDKAYLDSTRYSLQKSIQALYDYIVNILEGKSKLVQGEWTSRNVVMSTRNVITSNVSQVRELFDDTTISTNHTVVGLYQMLRAFFPVSVNKIKDYASKVFTGPNTPAFLVNPKTLEKESVSISPDTYDGWMTQEGMETVMNGFEIESLRHEPVMIEGKYFGLIYNDGIGVRFFQDIRDLPKEREQGKNVSPITYAELFYLAIAAAAAETPVLLTRYPITGYGSIYPSYVYLKTTSKGKRVLLINDAWENTDEVLSEFPIRGVPFVNSMSPSPNHLAASTADFDGDVMSCTPVLTTEGKEEIKKLLDSKSYYFGITGRPVFSAENDISKLVFLEMTS